METRPGIWHGKNRLESAQLILVFLTLRTDGRQQNTTPWDMGKSQPPLLDLMKSELGMKIQSGRSKEPRALVPGCGKVSKLV